MKESFKSVRFVSSFHLPQRHSQWNQHLDIIRGTFRMGSPPPALYLFDSARLRSTSYHLSAVSSTGLYSCWPSLSAVAQSATRTRHIWHRHARTCRHCSLPTYQDGNGLLENINMNKIGDGDGLPKICFHIKANLFLKGPEGTFSQSASCYEQQAPAITINFRPKLEQFWNNNNGYFTGEITAFVLSVLFSFQSGLWLLLFCFYYAAKLESLVIKTRLHRPDEAE